MTLLMKCNYDAVHPMETLLLMVDTLHSSSHQLSPVR